MILFGIFIQLEGSAQSPEHTYQYQVGDCYQVDVNDYVYGTGNGFQTCNIYSLDHVLIKSITLTPVTAGSATIKSISKGLFNSNSKYEIVYIYMNGTAHALRVIDEDGTVLLDDYNAYAVRFFNTDTGAKMMTMSSSANYVKIYSLPGTLYGNKSNTSNETGF